MKKIRFKKNNKIIYFQDMAMWRGVPSGIDFTIESIDNKRAVISAPGYGGKPYGNGKIFISRADNEIKLPRPLSSPESGQNGALAHHDTGTSGRGGGEL